jgi:hypothetical protein
VYKALGGGWQHFFAGNGLPPVDASVTSIMAPAGIEELPSVPPEVPPASLPTSEAAPNDVE